MDDDILLNQEQMFEKYYQDALAIRAICDDRDFPAEYSPVFVNIHVRGVEYFRNLAEDDQFFEQVFNLLDPSVSQKLAEKLQDLDSEEVRSIISRICIGEDLKNLDAYLADTEGLQNFLSCQIKNQKRLYLEEEFRAHMLALYIFFVKPSIASYTKEKIEQAFHRGRLQDMLRRINSRHNDDLEQDTA